jgi:hypothetical protein
MLKNKKTFKLEVRSRLRLANNSKRIYLTREVNLK